MVVKSTKKANINYVYSEITRNKMSVAKKKFFENGGKPWNKTDLWKECKNCKKKFRYIPSRADKAKFCSTACCKGFNVYDKGSIPWNKGKESWVRGKKHWNWQGGIDNEHTRIKQTIEYKNWQQAVYRKFRWTCQDCNIHCAKGNIIAHHLKPFSLYKKLRFVVDNGIVLCRKCHQIRHRPRRKNYHEQPIYAE